jgi:hypothetical protein
MSARGEPPLPACGESAGVRGSCRPQGKFLPLALTRHKARP